MSLSVNAADPIRLRQAAARFSQLVLMMILAACGGGGSGTTTESTAATAQISGTATLNWDPVEMYTNGSPVTNLAGYKIHFGTSAQAMDSVEVLENPSQTTYIVVGLAPGTWYFAVSAYTTAGAESALSNVASKTISPPP